MPCWPGSTRRRPPWSPAISWRPSLRCRAVREGLDQSDVTRLLEGVALAALDRAVYRSAAARGADPRKLTASGRHHQLHAHLTEPRDLRAQRPATSRYRDGPDHRTGEHQ